MSFIDELKSVSDRWAQSYIVESLEAFSILTRGYQSMKPVLCLLTVLVPISQEIHYCHNLGPILLQHLQKHLQFP